MLALVLTGIAVGADSGPTDDTGVLACLYYTQWNGRSCHAPDLEVSTGLCPMLDEFATERVVECAPTSDFGFVASYSEAMGKNVCFYSAERRNIGWEFQSWVNSCWCDGKSSDYVSRGDVEGVCIGATQPREEESARCAGCVNSAPASGALALGLFGIMLRRKS